MKLDESSKQIILSLLEKGKKSAMVAQQDAANLGNYFTQLCQLGNLDPETHELKQDLSEIVLKK